MMFLALNISFFVQTSDDGIPFLDEDYDSDRSQSIVMPTRVPSPSPIISYAITTSSATQPRLTAEQLQAIAERQKKAVASEPVTTKIGTVSAMWSCLYQTIVYEAAMHNGISLSEFGKHFPTQVESFVQHAQVTNSVAYDLQESIHDNIASSSSRKIGSYEVVGEMPEAGERLFNITSASQQFKNSIKRYIDTHHGDVQQRCLQHGLVETTSPTVWELCACRLQMHRPCVKQCKKSNVTSCLNPYCQSSSVLSPAPWTPAFYKKIIKTNPVVRGTKIKDELCLLCTEPLRATVSIYVPSASSSQAASACDGSSISSGSSSRSVKSKKARRSATRQEESN